ncbi:uncharacterized protein ISCGN_022459 [Ixodes scapularis]
MRLKNPFVFIVQILLDVLLVPISVDDATLGKITVSDVPLSASVIRRFDQPDTSERHKHRTHPLRNEYPRPIFDKPSSSTASFEAIKPGSGRHHDTGHGSFSDMRLKNPFVFIVQVRRHYYLSFRSNNVCLILLPCPRSCYSLLCNVIVYLKMLLLLSGDVEVNPGPDMKIIMEQLKAIAKDIQDIKNEKVTTNDRLSAIEQKLEGFSTLQTTVSACQEKITELEANIKTISKKLDDLENRSRRANLIIYGIEEKDTENSEILERVVSDEIFGKLLNTPISGIERIHRLGKKTDQRIRPVILKLLDCRDKTRVLKNCFKLKGTTFSISEDFSRPVQQIRKKLWESTKINRDKNDKVFLTFDKVRVNGQLYAWDEDKNDKVLIAKNDVTDHA